METSSLFWEKLDALAARSAAATEALAFQSAAAMTPGFVDFPPVFGFFIFCFPFSLLTFPTDVVRLLNATDMCLPSWVEEVTLSHFSTQEQKLRNPVHVDKALNDFLASAKLTVAAKAPLAELLKPAARLLLELRRRLAQLPREPLSLLELLVSVVHMVVLQVGPSSQVLPRLFRCARPDATFVLWLAQAGDCFGRLVPVDPALGFCNLHYLWSNDPDKPYAPFELIQRAFRSGVHVSLELRRAYLLSRGYILDFCEMAQHRVPEPPYAIPEYYWERWRAIQERMRSQFDGKLKEVKAPSTTELNRSWAALQPMMGDVNMLGQAPNASNQYGCF
jgi:hypothetical protein